MEIVPIIFIVASDIFGLIFVVAVRGGGRHHVPVDAVNPDPEEQVKDSWVGKCSWPCSHLTFFCFFETWSLTMTV